MKSRQGVIEIFLSPGDFYFGDASTRIRTVLGSCVAITMWHPRLKIGGMAHYLLPSRYTRVPGELDGRYADDAITLFLQEIHAARARPGDFEVKLFGGGSMFSGHALVGDDTQTDMLDVPGKNVEAAHELMHKHGFKVVAEHLGGMGHRNVIFDVWNGNVWIRHKAMGGAKNG